MEEKEIKISFPEAKMEALEFFLKENNETVEAVLKAHLDKTYEKCVPQQVRKFVENKTDSQTGEENRNEEAVSHQSNVQRRRNSKQNTIREVVQERVDANDAVEADIQDVDQEQENSMMMGI